MSYNADTDYLISERQDGCLVYGITGSNVLGMAADLDKARELIAADLDDLQQDGWPVWIHTWSQRGELQQDEAPAEANPHALEDEGCRRHHALLA